MVVVLILGLLMSTIYIATTPYFKRSRDAARIQDIASYGSIFSAYKQSADTFPTNYGSGGNALQK